MERLEVLAELAAVGQLTGGFDNGILNPMVPHVIYQVYAGDKQQVMVDFMQAYGVARIFSPRRRK